MIKDPWPMLWTSFTTAGMSDKRFGKEWYCKYSRRYTLPCATSRRKCKGCYMRQQAMSDHVNTYDRVRRNEGPPVVHICDRCQSEISQIDSIVYMEVVNRLGGLLATVELCPSCAGQLNEWINGRDINLDEIPEEEFEEFWE